MKLFVGIHLLIFAPVICSVNSECKFDPFEEDAPLPVQPGGEEIKYPQSDQRELILEENEEIDFICPEGRITLKSTPVSDVVQAKCSPDHNFIIKEGSYSGNEIKCDVFESRKSPVTVKPTNKDCGEKSENESKEIQIGFLVSDKRFIQQIRICFNTVKETTLYAQYNMAVSSVTRPRNEKKEKRNWEQDDDFFKRTGNVKKVYITKIQRKSINTLLGLNSNNTAYIENNNNKLSRGHIAPAGDFLYPLQRIATYRYINVAPQWSTINSANWNIFEENVRGKANDKQFNSQVWAGTYGIATLPNEKTGEDVELYLKTTAEYKTIPVPALFWKLIYDPDSKKCIVLITHNNRYQNKDSICTDISHEIRWLKWKREEDKIDTKRGYSYACNYASFYKKVGYPIIAECSLKTHVEL